jgi:hypothetical protein
MADSNVDGDGGEVDGDGGGVDGDGFGGTSLSRQGAGTETSVPRNWSSTAAALQNFTGKNVNSFRVWSRKALYRWRGGVRGGPGGPHHRLAWPRGGAPALGVAAPWPPSGSHSVFILCLGKIGGSGFVSSNSEYISCVAFLKHKNSRK